MKNIIMILVCYLVCINLCSCSNNYLSEGYTEEVTDKIVINNIKIEKHTINAEYQKEEGVFSYPDHSYLNASIEFPQLSDMKDISVQEKINKQLKDVVMQSLNNRNSEDTLKLFQAIANEKNGTSEFWGGENEYNILYIEDMYLSLNYVGNCFFGGARPSYFSNYVTIGLETGKIISFTECFSKEKILDAITSLEFEWIDGQYTGGYTNKEPEVIEKFVAAVNQLEDVDTINNDYNSAGTYNFAMDEQFAYISFPFYDSLDGYATLRFNHNTLK